MLINTQKQENNNSSFKRFILILVLAIAMTGSIDPGKTEEIKGRLDHSGSGFNTVHAIGLCCSRDCINTDTHGSSDQSQTFERNAGGFDICGFSFSDSRPSAIAGGTNLIYILSQLLYLGAIICLLSYFHIYFIHLQDGKK